MQPRDSFNSSPVRLSCDETGFAGAFSHTDRPTPKCCWAFPIREGVLAISIFTMVEAICNVALLYMFSYEILRPMQGIDGFLIFFIASAALTVVANAAGFLVIWKNWRIMILVYTAYLLAHWVLSAVVYVIFVRASYLSFVSAEQTPCPPGDGFDTCEANKSIFSSFVVGFSVAFGCALLLRMFFVYETYCYYAVVKKIQQQHQQRRRRSHGNGKQGGRRSSFASSAASSRMEFDFRPSVDSQRAAKTNPNYHVRSSLNLARASADLPRSSREMTRTGRDLY